MKNNNDHEIIRARGTNIHRAMPTDILRSPVVIQNNQRRLTSQPKRKRRRDYIKKIMNDPYIFLV